MERADITSAIEERFEGPSGIAKLREIYQLIMDCAEAQAPKDEIIAAVVAECQVSKEDAMLVYAFAADDVEMCALAAKSRLRRAIMAACRSEQPSAARVGLLKEFAYQHLDWSRKPLDDETRDALRDADKLRRQGKVALDNDS